MDFTFKDYKNRVVELCEKHRFTLIYERTNEPYPNNIVHEFGHDDDIIPQLGGNSRFQMKGLFIYKVIRTKKFHISEGEKLKVTDEEIQKKFNKYLRWVEILESFDLEKEFVDCLYVRARQVLDIEKKELEMFESESILVKLIHTDKYLVTLRTEIQKVKKELGKINSQIASVFEKIRLRKITGLEYDGEMDRLEEGYHIYFGRLDWLMRQYKQKSETAVERKRTRLKQCFQFSELHSIQPTEFPFLKYQNIVTTEFLVNEYCQWKRENGRTEKVKQNERAKSERKKQSRKKNKEYTPQFIQKQERVLLIRPLVEEGLNPSQIAKKTELPKSTVQRIVDDLRGNE